MPRDRSRTLRATAYHEAGHAVAAHEYGLEISAITIRPDAYAFGYATTVHPAWYLDNPPAGTPIPNDAQILKYVVDLGTTLYAGAASERLFMGRSSHIAANKDYEEAARNAARVCGSERELLAMTKWLQITAEELVAADLIRERIEAVAQALLQRGGLTRAEAAEVIEAAPVGSIDPEPI